MKSSNIKRLNLDALVVCGGEDTLGVAAVLAERGVPIVGVPKTIDKDLAGTDYTLGFDTALKYLGSDRTFAHVCRIAWLGADCRSDGRGTRDISRSGRVWPGRRMILIPEHPFRYERVFHLLSARLGESDLSRGCCLGRVTR